MIPVLRPPLASAPPSGGHMSRLRPPDDRRCLVDRSLRGRALLLVGVSPPQRGRHATSAAVERIAKGFVRLSPPSASGVTAEEQAQRLIWHQWRSHRPSNSGQGEGELVTYTAEEVIVLEPPLVLENASGGAANVLGVKNITIQIWQLLEGHAREKLIEGYYSYS